MPQRSHEIEIAGELVSPDVWTFQLPSRPVRPSRLRVRVSRPGGKLVRLAWVGGATLLRDEVPIDSALSPAGRVELPYAPVLRGRILALEVDGVVGTLNGLPLVPGEDPPAFTLVCETNPRALFKPDGVLLVAASTTREILAAIPRDSPIVVLSPAVARLLEEAARVCALEVAPFFDEFGPGEAWATLPSACEAGDSILRSAARVLRVLQHDPVLAAAVEHALVEKSLAEDDAQESLE